METDRIVKNLKEFNEHDWKAFESKLEEKTELYNKVMFSINEDFKTIYKYYFKTNMDWRSCEDWGIEDIKLVDPNLKPSPSNIRIIGLKYISYWMPLGPATIDDNDHYTISIDEIYCADDIEFTMDTPLTSLLTLEGCIIYNDEDDECSVHKYFTCTNYDEFCKRLETKEYTHYYSEKTRAELKTYILETYEELYKSYEQFLIQVQKLFKIYINISRLYGYQFRKYMLKYNWNIEFDAQGNVIQKL